MGSEFEIAIKVAPHHIEWETMLWVARHADTNSVYSDFWNFDHFYPIYGDSSGPCLESWVTLSAIAQATSRIRIGCMVNGVHYRHPAVVANMASGLDIISDGRFELGLGAGWNQEESGAYGIHLGSLTERFDRFDEALAVIFSLLHEERTSFKGEYFSLKEALNNPKGPQERLPICIGGTGEKRTLPNVAKYASHWNLPSYDKSLFTNKLNSLKLYCGEIGRDVKEIKISTHIFVEEATDEETIIEQLRTQEEAGINQSIIYFQPPVTREKVRSVTELLSNTAR